MRGRFAALQFGVATDLSQESVKRLYAVVKVIENITGEIGFLKSYQQGTEPIQWVLCSKELRPMSKHRRWDEERFDLGREIEALRTQLNDTSSNDPGAL